MEEHPSERAASEGETPAGFNSLPLLYRSGDVSKTLAQPIKPHPSHILNNPKFVEVESTYREWRKGQGRGFTGYCITTYYITESENRFRSFQEFYLIALL